MMSSGRIPPLIYFLHIPKTAGTTLLQYVSAQVAPDRLITTYGGELAFYAPDRDFVARVRSRCDPKTVIYGHYGFGAHLLLDDQQPRYVTFFRDPTRRILSFFAHQAREPQARLYDAIAKGLTLKTAIAQHLAPEVNNYVTRILTTDLSLVEALRTNLTSLRFAAGVWNGLGHGPGGPYDQILHRAHYQMAVEHLDRHFAFVGIAERMQESMVRLAHGMGWSTPGEDLILNAATESHPPVDDETEALISTYNASDIDLYRRCGENWLEAF
ncbi:MAG TPA: hypothetical protein VHZ07_18170 [Bryobacteraceae bacterium]|jgi:hypothetical protein|nr:hypothetical protein [Bryobacteraceae bacterium]